MTHPERIVPDETSAGIVAVHLKRYDFALPWCEGRQVLDAGCGVGYGTARLAPHARSVLGVDVSGEAVEYARMRYAAPNVEFRRMDLLALDLPDDTFDAACCFETLEHLDSPEAAVAELARVLRAGGVLIASTPHVPVTTRSPDNPHHRVELSRWDFEQLLTRHFEHVDLYGQRRLESHVHRVARRLDVFGLRRRLAFARAGARLTGSRPMADLTADDLAISNEQIETATELVAVCRLA